MGNCCGSVDDVKTKPAAAGAFKGEGHRLGTANEAKVPANNGAAPTTRDDNLPPARHDPTITDSVRERQRQERIAAAEERIKKAGGNPPPKKKKENKDAPLVGPNSEPLMRWTAG